MSALLDAMISRIKPPIEGAKVERTERGFRIRVPIEVVISKIKEDMSKSFKERGIPIPPEVVSIENEGGDIVLSVKVI